MHGASPGVAPACHSQQSPLLLDATSSLQPPYFRRALVMRFRSRWQIVSYIAVAPRRPCHLGGPGADMSRRKHARVICGCVSPLKRAVARDNAGYSL